MSDPIEETPSFPTAEGGVSAFPLERGKWLITGRYQGMHPGYMQNLAENLNWETAKHFPGRHMSYGNNFGYCILLEATDLDLIPFLEIYKKTVEIWGADIRFSQIMRITTVRNI